MYHLPATQVALLTGGGHRQIAHWALVVATKVVLAAIGVLAAASVDAAVLAASVLAAASAAAAVLAAIVVAAAARRVVPVVAGSKSKSKTSTVAYEVPPLLI